MWPALAASLAFGGNAAISAGGGSDGITQQPWAGLDLALFPGQDKGFAAHGRLTSGWGFIDGAPLGALELGATGVIPNDEAILRLGFAARMGALYAEYPVGLTIGALGAEGAPALGLLPGGEMLVEFEWGDEAPFTLRVAAGITSQASALYCGSNGSYDECLGWRPGFLGGVSARGRLKNGLFGEILGGPSLYALVGYGFPINRRSAR
jgi:hypothetical protein